MDELLGRRAVVEDAFVAFFENDHATALDARIVGPDRSRNEIRKGDVGNEPAALVHLQPGLFPILPLGHAHLAAEHAGVYAHVRDRLGERKGAAPWFAIFAWLRRRGETHVVLRLLGRAALVNRG